MYVSDKQLIAVLFALANEIRLDIYRNVLHAYNEGVPINLLESTRPHKLVRPSISHHVGILVESGLVSRERKGKNVFLKINPQGLDSALAALATLRPNQ
jgi:ArsR family transcriptional regulator